MKTPDEIKKSLKICLLDEETCEDCAYYYDGGCHVAQLKADTLAYINQLENQLRNATKMVAPAPTWISIKEKLPEREVKMLVVNGHGYISILAFWKKELNKWTWTDAFGRFNHVNDITHWMSLPEPPKEESK